MRECGECIACCVYPRIPILEKEGMVKCVNLLESEKMFSGEKPLNCKIYTDRPGMCIDYECAWLLGHGEEEDRPDKSYLLFDCSKRIGNSLECKPLSQNAEKNTDTIERMSVSFGTPVIVLNFYERRIVKIVGRGYGCT